MFRQALSEVRLHPGRFVSTLLAIAISVAFLAGSAVLVATEGQAQGMAMNVSSARADVVVTAPLEPAVPGIAAVLKGTEGVASLSPVLATSVLVTAGTNSESIQVVNVPPEPLRWATLTAGTWPVGPRELTLSGGAAKSLGLSVGATVRVSGTGEELKIVGITNEPSGLFAKTGYGSEAYLAAQGVRVDQATTWTVKRADGVSEEALIRRLATALQPLNPNIEVLSAAAVRAKTVAELANGLDAFTYVLWGFGAVALVVGMITISNTFSITLAQRRRQIGLLRAVGASGAQVRRRFLAEAALLGVIGSLLGVLLGVGLAAGATAWSSALFWGLALPWGQLALALGLGVLATLVSAFVPVVKGTRVLPLEALQPVLSAGERRRGTVVRAVVCGLLVVAGGGLAALATLYTDPKALLWGIGSGALISAGVLFGASLFVPALLRLTGVLVRRFGTVPRLAADNAERNPRRATATATALMLAIGLMVTLQVATASLRSTVLDQVAQQYPVDVQVSWGGMEGKAVPIPEATAERLAAVSGVDASVRLPAAMAELDGEPGVTVLGYRGEIARVTGVTTPVAADEVLVNEHVAEGLGKTVELKGSKGDLTLKVRKSPLVSYEQVMVASENLARLGGEVPSAVMWLSIPDRSRAVPVMAAVGDIVGDWSRLQGSISDAALYEQVLDILLGITSALLGVAVLIALIGVSNTLGLSVLERTRESALLRALGLQASSLRAMLTIEAMQVTLVGVLVGVASGAFFGWLAVTATARAIGFDHIVFSVNAGQTLGMIAIAMAAAALASILPGRRAAKAVPTEALADI